MSEVDISAQSANGWVLCIRASYGDEALARFIEAQQAEIERLSNALRLAGDQIFCAQDAKAARPFWDAADGAPIE